MADQLSYDELYQIRLELIGERNELKTEIKQLQADNEWFQRVLETIVSMKHHVILQDIIAVAERAIKENNNG